VRLLALARGVAEDVQEAHPRPGRPLVVVCSTSNVTSRFAPAHGSRMRGDVPAFSGPSASGR
jgi:hypothetical protein